MNLSTTIGLAMPRCTTSAIPFAVVSTETKNMHLDGLPGGLSSGIGSNESEGCDHVAKLLTVSRR